MLALDLAPEAAVSDPSPDPEQRLRNVEALARVGDALALERPGVRAMFIDWLESDEALSTLAARHRTSVEAAKSHLMRVRRRIRGATGNR